MTYHKLDRKNLETLIYTYLGDWITRQRCDLADRVDGAASRLAAAEALKQRLELILAGEGALRHLRALEAAGRATHRLEPRPQ